MLGRSNENAVNNGTYNNAYNENYNEVNDITLEEAYTITNAYILSHLTGDIIIEEAYEFYGYYTFHLEQNSQMVGMLSVNGFTGEVWYHDWHGQAGEHK